MLQEPKSPKLAFLSSLRSFKMQLQAWPISPSCELPLFMDCTRCYPQGLPVAAELSRRTAESGVNELMGCRL